MRVLAVFHKEMLEALKNRLLLFSLLPLPVIFTAIPLAFVYFSRGQPVSQEEAEIYYRLSPSFADMDPRDVIQIIMVGQFMFFFLMTPVIVPLTIATFSIIGEKQAHSLEPLLATPVRTWELLLGKGLAAVVPAVVLTWLSYGTLLAGLAVLASPAVFGAVVSGMWLLAIVVLTPLVAVLSVNLGVMVSSRVNDTRAAQQIGGLIVLPIVGLGVAQTLGKILYSLPMFAAGAVAIAVLDGCTLLLAVMLFRRETILTRWK